MSPLDFMSHHGGATSVGCARDSYNVFRNARTDELNDIERAEAWDGRAGYKSLQDFGPFKNPEQSTEDAPTWITFCEDECAHERRAVRQHLLHVVNWHHLIVWPSHTPKQSPCYSRQLARIRWVALLRIPIILIRRILQRRLILLPPRRRIVRQSPLHALTPHTRQGLCVRGGLAQRIVALGEAASRLPAGADVDGRGVGAAEVGFGRWLVRKREVGLALVDDLGFGLVAGGVDDGLGTS